MRTLTELSTWTRARWLGLVRLIVSVTVIAGEVLNTDPRTVWPLFAALGAVAVLYSVATIVAADRLDGEPSGTAMTTLADLALLMGLTIASGGPTSEVRRAYLVLPLAAALVAQPRAVAAWATAAFCAYSVTALPAADPSEATAADVAAHALYVACAGAVGVLLSVALRQREREILRLAEAHGRLASHALEAEEAERSRLSHVLHDEAMQTLLAAQFELSRMRRGDPRAAARAMTALGETIERLRGTLRDLHPYMLDHAGLSAALQQQAERAATLSDANVRLHLDADACGRDDSLAFTIARELLDNAARHSGASTIAVELRCHDVHLELQVRDDGVGIAPERPSTALVEGHIGLAACGQRLSSRGGTLAIDGSELGTSVVARWPANIGSLGSGR